MPVMRKIHVNCVEAMRKIKSYSIVCLLAAFSVFSCSEDPIDPTHSVITVAKRDVTDLDRWLDVNYVKPYNIDFKYRFELNESDMNYYTIPADYGCAIKMANLVKYLCIDTYDEVAGIDFTRSYFPKMFFLIGEFEYRNNGTMILGTAEGGKKIFLTGVNHLPYAMDQGSEVINEYYIKTIHHEFTHILNQTRDYPVDFSLITGKGYVADSWSEEPYRSEYLQNGFITSYAQHSSEEDFAETVSTYITNDKDYWDGQIRAAGEAGKNISAKLEIARTYMKDTWNVDMDVLRDVIQRRQKDVFGGRVDMDDITIR